MVLTKIKVKRGATTAWHQPAPAEGVDPTVLEEGEIGYDYETNTIKICHNAAGSARWADLPAANLRTGGSTPSTNLSEKQFFFNTVTKQLSIYFNGAWQTVAGTGGTGTGLENGTVQGQIKYWDNTQLKWLNLNPSEGYLKWNGTLLQWDSSVDQAVDSALSFSSTNPPTNTLVTQNIKYAADQPLTVREVGGLTVGIDISNKTVKEVLTMILFGSTAPSTDPTTVSYTPQTGYNNGPVAFSISGLNLANVDAVKMSRSGSADIIATDLVSEAEFITCTFDLDDKDSANNWMINMFVGENSYPVGYFTIQHAVPTISGVSPNTCEYNQTLTGVQITGANYNNGATVYLSRSGYNQIDATNITVVDANHITCNIWIPNVASYTGSWNLYVKNADGTPSAAYTFVVSAPDLPAPVVTSLNPVSALEGASAQITVNGSYFQNGASVRLGNSLIVNPANFVDASTLTAQFSLPVGDTGVKTVTVTNPDTKTSNTNITFTIMGAQPTVTSVSPTQNNIGVSTQFTVNGGYFNNGCKVILKKTGETDVVIDTSWISANQIKFVSTLSGMAEGLWEVHVRNLDNQVSANTAVTIRANPPLPNISAISPQSSERSSTIAMTITGSNFRAGATVTMSNGTETINGTGVVITTTQITCNFDMSTRTAGNWTLTVTNTDLNASSKTFCLQPFVPGVTSIEPPTLMNNATYNLAVNGTNFETGANNYSYVVVSKSGQSDRAIVQTVSKTSTRIEVKVDMNGAQSGTNWDVYVKTINPCGTVKTCPTPGVLAVTSPPSAGSGLYVGLKDYNVVVPGDFTGLTDLGGLTFTDGWTPPSSQLVTFTVTADPYYTAVVLYPAALLAASAIKNALNMDMLATGDWIYQADKTIEGTVYKAYMYNGYLTDTTSFTFYWAV